MTEEELYTSHRLCTDHFKEDDLDKHAKHIRIKQVAVPCIYTYKSVTCVIANAIAVNNTSSNMASNVSEESIKATTSSEYYCFLCTHLNVSACAYHQ